MNDLLIEQVAAAWRARDVFGRIEPAPAWHDLTDAERVEAFRRATLDRTLEAALDPDGLSSTGRAVMARIVEGSAG